MFSGIDKGLNILFGGLIIIGLVFGYILGKLF